jgi:hypothetical protein
VIYRQPRKCRFFSRGSRRHNYQKNSAIGALKTHIAMVYGVI